jgi:tyrosyl-tRNA synthetase
LRGAATAPLTCAAMDIIDELQWRGLVADCTDETELRDRLKAGPITVYCGFDPTASSLHVGNLVPLFGLRRFQLAGHRPIAIAGGATGSIGDPSGKTAERQLLTSDAIAENIARQKEQLSRWLDFGTDRSGAILLDNADWTAPISFLDFLRDIGKHFSVNAMIAKESVRARMEDRESGISYTEFSYMLLQAYDFYYLRKEYDCELQIGGSDQWGNITAGTDLIRRKLSARAFGLTMPLITNADGTKFGKTAEGAVWLDPDRTSPYRFYQFWIRTDDRDVIRYLKFFTFLGRPEIEDLERRHDARPEAREAHAALAREVTALVHGEDVLREVVRASEVLFGAELDGISERTFLEIVGEVPTQEVAVDAIASQELPLIDALVMAGLSSSKGQARKDVAGGGIYINNVRETDAQRTLSAGDLLFERYVLLRKGKRNYAVLARGRSA